MSPNSDMLRTRNESLYNGTMSIHNRMAVLRTEKGLSQAQLAGHVGVNRQTIGLLEGGNYVPSLEIAFKISRFFDLPMEAVFSPDPFRPLSEQVYTLDKRPITEVQTSKAASRLRRALQWRTRPYRRRQVFWFYLFMLVGASITLGGDHHDFVGLEWALLLPAIAALTALKEWSRWSYQRRRCVSSLDDRAQVAHGLNFEQLSAAEQKDVLRRYQMGSRLLDETPDERQQAAGLQAGAAAFQFLRTTLICFAAGYWAVYLWMPSGGWRNALTDSPVIISWLAVFIISLPQVIEIWSEPGETISEPELCRD